ncbi:MAG: 50S ribosomal protein P1 [Candidatus Korarchaeota archaeon]|nr:50S ribosomal protein P1 [Candidatus Korarchaeota archaeon]NIU83451.1 50S ribosomal protein P1 [Candidatus Thorarchaeota archaeon]NIW13727.1 50S ribosomal protein P1 [Candidatus Thorarchaeota archaeon]NIW51822.1 50S ribosomal protein P1 [Candidatus Korarchaeota archaeon]
MAYIFAALLLNEAGRKPEATSITSVLKAAGVNEEELNDGFAQAIESSLEEIDINSIKTEALAFKPATAPAEAEAGKEEKIEEEEEEPEEEEEEESVEGLSSLF